MQVHPSSQPFTIQNSSLFRRSVWTLVILSFASAMASHGQNYNVLARFDNGTGGSPIDIVQGTDGNYYGVGITGGNNAGGSIFKVTPAGNASRLYAFCATAPCQDGKGPNGLVLASDGNFYGTVFRGGSRDSGGVFRLTTDGTVSILHSFCTGAGPCTGGVHPVGELIQGSDGALYGTTSQGGSHNGGVIFRITLAGEFAVLYSFCSQPNCADGVSPNAGLVEATNGSFYGTTLSGGANGPGTIFRLSPAGKLSTLYSFCAQLSCADGAYPRASLMQGSDGNLYGTTSSGGMTGGACGDGCGTIFAVPPGGGSFVVVHAFAHTDGAQPQKLIQGTDGTFYGTARSGGPTNVGTLFKFGWTRSVTVLFNFCSSGVCKSSANPAGLIQSTNGLFYGTTTGPGNGVVFTYGFPPFITMSPASGPVGTTVRIYGTDLSSATEVTFNGGAQATFTVVAPGEIDASVPPGALYGPVKVTTPAGVLVSDRVFRITP